MSTLSNLLDREYAIIMIEREIKGNAERTWNESTSMGVRVAAKATISLALVLLVTSVALVTLFPIANTLLLGAVCFSTIGIGIVALSSGLGVACGTIAHMYHLISREGIEKQLDTLRQDLTSQRGSLDARELQQIVIKTEGLLKEKMIEKMDDIQFNQIQEIVRPCRSTCTLIPS